MVIDNVNWSMKKMTFMKCLVQESWYELCRRDGRVGKGTLLIAEAIGQEFEPASWPLRLMPYHRHYIRCVDSLLFFLIPTRFSSISSAKGSLFLGACSLLSFVTLSNSAIHFFNLVIMLYCADWESRFAEPNTDHHSAWIISVPLQGFDRMLFNGGLR